MIRGQMIHHGISRNAKHISVIVCASTTGTSLIPKGMTLQLKNHGAASGADFVLKSNLKTFVGADMPLDYTKTVFLFIY
jgi:hypothetical protein